MVTAEVGKVRLVVAVAVVSAVVAGGVVVALGEAPPTVAGPDDVPNPVAHGVELPQDYVAVRGRDEIAPIYDPTFVEADAAGWPDDALVVGLALDGDARAYPIAPLNHREMVIDEVAGRPVLVSWCPLCGTAMVHDRELDGEVLVFGNQGDLYGNAMTWWDHATGSVWSQPTGEALMGPLKGERLDLVPSTMTEWGAWREAHPDTLALDVPAGADHVGLGELVVVVAHDDEAVGFLLAGMPADGGVVSDRVGGLPVAVVADPTGVRPWQVFLRRVDGRQLRLRFDDGRVIDRRTGTAWNAATGQGVEGPLAHRALAPLPAHTVFPGDFSTFYPYGEIRELRGE